MGGMRLPYSRHSTLLESYAEHKAIVAAIEARKIRAALTALKANSHSAEVDDEFLGQASSLS